MYDDILDYTNKHNVTLVAVSKTKPDAEILKLYNKGQRIFGENRVQELTPKYQSLPKDIKWHLIGHLQSNKVKYIAPFVAMIESVDSLDLLKVIHKEAVKNHRVIPVLLQFYIAKEETKFGLNMDEAILLLEYLKSYPMSGISIKGVMGMASFTDDKSQVTSEFQNLKKIFSTLKTTYFAEDASFKEISMGMSGDFKEAIEEGSTMVRIGSAIFRSMD